VRAARGAAGRQHGVQSAGRDAAEAATLYCALHFQCPVRSAGRLYAINL
jgi:hypothetical protein